MKNRVLNSFLLSLVAGLIVLTGCGKKWTETKKGTIRIVTNEGEQTLPGLFYKIRDQADRKGQPCL